MSVNLKFIGKLAYSIDPALNTVQLSVEELDNTGTTRSGTIRLELWLTTVPWNPNGSNTGYEIAVDQLSGSSNGTLGPQTYFSNISDTVSYRTHPPAGTYFVTLVAAEYTGTSPGIDNGFVIDTSFTFSNYISVGTDGRLTQIQTPSVSVATQAMVEGDSGSSNMVFTLTLSNPSPFSVSVQVDTRGETAAANFDYLPVHQRVTFAPGATTATVSVPILGNTSFEPSRAFELNLSAPINATVEPNYADPTGTLQASPQASAWGMIIDDDLPAGVTLPTDTYFSLQWYLYETRVELAWSHATGKGVKVAIFDQGIDASNPELSTSDNVGLGRVGLSLLPGGAPVLAGDNHGTQVAGLIGAARDGKGIVGVAYDAQLVSIYTPSSISLQYLTEIANAFRYAAKMDVLNNSWGFGNLLMSNTNWAFLDDARNPQFAPAFAALHDLAATGRDGLGTVVVQSAGNAYSYGDDTNLHNFQNSRYIITVGATDYFGTSSVFSTTGASILISAPGGAGNRDFSSILTLDRTGASGANSGNFAFNDGTSFSAPIVSGIVAQMLEVNPRLGYRDVQQILAYTAHQVDTGKGEWSSNGAIDWNGGGLRYNAVIQSSGFGLVDALAAVRLAESWTAEPQTVANTVEVISSQSVNKAIPDRGVAGISSTIHVDAALRVERADVTVNVTHPYVGDLEIDLVSPSGTVSYLMYRPSQGSLSAFGSSQHDLHFTFDTVLDWGESAAGNWTLTVRDLQSGDVGTFNDWTLDLIGKAENHSHTFVFTNEFADMVALDPSRATLSDPLGVNDTINASVLASDTRIDLSGATPSVIIGANLTIAKGTTIRNAYGGEGKDTLIANSAGSTLHGLGGVDRLVGGVGNDVLDGGAGGDNIDGGSGLDTAVYHGDRSNFTITHTAAGFTVADRTGAEGMDSLVNVERLVFADKAYALDLSGVAGQTYRLYQAAFNRTPDQGGLGYWISVMDKGGSLNDVSAGFVNSNEFRDVYGGNPTNHDIVLRFYTNVLHRAPDAAGLNYWVNVLDTKAASVASVLAGFSESQENQDGLAQIIGNGFEYKPFV